MKLVRLELHGFKSFAQPTELRFHDGITAIVGPNGCGKSNIGDAIRWVLGEQRASAIRSSRMDDAIFQGTAHRRGLNRAEVALVLSNEESRLPIPHREVEVRRVMFREGGSDYQLNRQSCRLRDIHDLLRNTGLGANAYSVIEQGMVDAILSDRAEERRQLFEEAAGVGLYKDRRKSAMRRLDAAESDLARLKDVIAEVESNVRSLARQGRKAQRYKELRQRRLSLELAIANHELERAQRALDEASARLEALAREEASVRAELAAAETNLERLRLETAEHSRARGAVAARLDDVNRLISEREREAAVAGERWSHTVSRVQQIAVERQELDARVRLLEEELESAMRERTAREASTARAGERVQEVQRRLQAQRDALSEARAAEASARSALQELGRRMARLEADAAAADARARDAAARILRLDERQRELRAELARLTEQQDLFAAQYRGLVAQRETVSAEATTLKERLEALRAEELGARRTLAEVEERTQRLATLVAALEALERDYHGFTPAVAAALANRDRIAGLEGPLTDYLDLAPERAAAVEGALASLLQVLVVRDAGAAEAVRTWLSDAKATEPPSAGGRGGSARSVSGQGMLALVPKGELPRVTDLLAVLEFVGEPPAEPVLIGRRERLARLRREADAADRERAAVAARRSALLEQVAAAESAVREADARCQAVELEIRRADADEAARTGQHDRAERALAELAAERQALQKAVEAANHQRSEAQAEHARLVQELEALRIRADEASSSVGALEAAWEAVREEESEARVAHAREEAALGEARRRIDAIQAALASARDRAAELDREEAAQKAATLELERARAAAAAALEELFASRDQIATELRALDENLESVTNTAEATDRRVRELRRRSDEMAEERHRLELRQSEARAELRAVRQRLEAEWGRPFEQLAQSVAPADGEPEVLRAELSAVAAEIDRLGPVNMLAVEAHEEERKRLEFLNGQREDLERACEDLRSAIRQINRTARQMYLETFEAVRANFRRTFSTLFQGGECDLWLADPDDPLESAIEVSASPRGKRTQRIHLLSGGERALTALALLFAIYLVKPSPFCVLDEVDAPLDEANVARFIGMLQEFKSSTQFIVITHNPRTMEAADWIYGVTMEEPGVSTIVGVQLDEAVAPAAAT